MKAVLKIISVFIFFTFFSTSCENKEITVENSIDNQIFEKEEVEQDGRLFNKRYGEIMPLHFKDGKLVLTIYNTIGCNNCPQGLWNGLNIFKIMKDYKAIYVRLNGPRYWLLDDITGPETKIDCATSFNGLKSSIVAYVPFELTLLANIFKDSYAEIPVERNTVWHFYKGRRVYILKNPKGKCFIMQAYSHIVDNDLKIEELRILGKRLELPKDWKFKTFILKEAINLQSPNKLATIVQDDLKNTYMHMPSGCNLN